MTTKCPGNGCALKNNCERYTAPSTNRWQSYFVDVPIKTGDECDFFIPSSRYGNNYKKPDQHVSTPDVDSQSDSDVGSKDGA